jgi:pyrimidine-nucleoside phosphorylase
MDVPVAIIAESPDRLRCAPHRSSRMNVAQLIAKKRDGGELSDGEIADLIGGYMDGEVADYQMSAFTMAVCLRGMSAAETTSLTLHMLHSGTTLAWEDGPPTVDKHSSGGVGDKTSLVLAPLLACCGVRVPKISGRGLGPTGGTLDKLESIPGYRTDLSIKEIRLQTDSLGCVITGATDDLVPADRRLYALRDVTATVDCLPLIAASIMSKKLAEGLDALVLDVKFGSGAFMKSRAEGEALARAMVDIGNHLGVATTALLSDMNQPLGRMIGNAVEVDEALAVLAGEGPADVRELVLQLAGEVLLSAGVVGDHSDGRELAAAQLASSAAAEKFADMVGAQGGDLDRKRTIAPRNEVAAARDGVVTAIDAEQLGYAAIELGGGRRRKSDAIDHSVGLEMLVRIGDPVESGRPLLNVFAPPERARQMRSQVLAAVTISEESCEPPPLIVERIDRLSSVQ